MAAFLVSLALLLPVGERIFSGQEVSEQHFQSAVSLIDRHKKISYKGHRCGGVLVASRWVLTAAHCMPGKLWRRTDVIVGRKNLAEAGGQRLSVVAMRKHPKYSLGPSGAPVYDFALLRLSAPARTEPIRRLWLGDTRPGTKLWVGGWGATEYETLPVKMLETRVRSFSDQYCRQRYGSGPTVFCAGRKEGKFDACYGDSGGPIIERRGRREILWGLVSFGRGCGLRGYPGAYSRVAAVAPWIKATLISRPRGIRVRPTREVFPDKQPQDLGPLSSVRAQTPSWQTDDPERPYTFIFKVQERVSWPLQKIVLRVMSDVRVCGWYGCDSNQWEMEEDSSARSSTRPKEWFLYLQSAVDCLPIELRAHLRDRVFRYRETFCQSP